MRTHCCVVLLASARAPSLTSRNALVEVVTACVDGDIGAWLRARCLSSSDAILHAMLADIGEHLLERDAESLGALYLSIACRASLKHPDSLAALADSGFDYPSAQSEPNGLRQRWLLRALGLLPEASARDAREDILASLEAFIQAGPRIASEHGQDAPFRPADSSGWAAAFETLAGTCFESGRCLADDVTLFSRLCQLHGQAGSAVSKSSETALLSSGNRHAADRLYCSPSDSSSGFSMACSPRTAL